MEANQKSGGSEQGTPAANPDSRSALIEFVKKTLYPAPEAACHTGPTPQPPEAADGSESEFFAGLPGRLTRHVAGVAGDILGVAPANRVEWQGHLTDERLLLAEEQLLLTGVSDWPEDQPCNRRYQGTFWRGSRPLCDLCVVSLLGTYRLAQMGKRLDLTAAVADCLRALDQRNRPAWRQSAVLAVVVLVPGSLQPALTALPHQAANEHCFYVLVQGDKPAGPDRFRFHRPDRMGPHLWLALDPGTEDEKTERLVDHLVARLEMDQVAQVTEIAKELDWPVLFVERSVQSIARSDTRFQAITNSDRLHAVKRVRMLNS